MKTIKLTVLLIAAGIVVLFGYANVRQRSVTEKLKPVNLISFQLRGELIAEEVLILEKKISALPGVTACTVNQEGNTAAITFYPERITEHRLASLLATEGNLTVTPKEIVSTGGCPVHQAGTSFQKLLTSLDIRN